MLTLSVTCKLIQLCLHEHVTTVELKKNSQPILGIYLKKKLIWESLKESPNYRFDLVQALMTETLSVSFPCHVHVEHSFHV